eukprot:955385-Amphidinium_carterae.4
MTAYSFFPEPSKRREHRLMPQFRIKGVRLRTEVQTCFMQLQALGIELNLATPLHQVAQAPKAATALLRAPFPWPACSALLSYLIRRSSAQ